MPKCQCLKPIIVNVVGEQMCIYLNTSKNSACKVKNSTILITNYFSAIYPLLRD